MQTCKCAMAQALVAFLVQQYVERDGRERPFFAGMFRIFGTATWPGAAGGDDRRT